MEAGAFTKKTEPSPASATLAALVLLLWCCSPVMVSLDYDVSADFAKYRTFDWYPGPQPKTGDVRVDSPLLDGRIRKAVTDTMLAKGYRRVTGAHPDLYLAYHLTIRSKIEADTFNTGIGYGGYPYWGGVGYETRIREYDEGMLIVDVIDVAAGKLVWRGTGTRRVTETSDPEKSTRVVNQTVAEILAQFPPQPN
jgi:hypothetical protein